MAGDKNKNGRLGESGHGGRGDNLRKPNYGEVHPGSRPTADSKLGRILIDENECDKMRGKKSIVAKSLQKCETTP